ncbi:hypothetical protein MY5147_004132 [Beauveria neobassiana]|uniref:Uncharacterized protein n=1 Tax=Beauveria bassiana TaxID=176275 RepID=A0A2S7XW74_BEABA|nr:hypothetical protein BB8028_0001g00030 [Beauveria bassiana]
MERVRLDLATFVRSTTTTRLDKIFKAVGVLCWALTYACVVYVNFTQKTSLIRRDVVEYNFTWEIFRTFLWNDNDERLLTMIIGIGWTVLDALIVAAIFLYGDGTDNVGIPEQRAQFAAWSAFYITLSMVMQNAGPEYARVWRHASYWWAILVNMSITRHSFAYSTENPFIGVMAWCNFVGNATYLYSCWGLYQSWYYPMKHPVRFFMVATCFIPALLNNLVFIVDARLYMTTTTSKA